MATHDGETTTDSGDIDYTRFDLLRPMEAAVRENVTVKTIYSRAQNGYYKSINDSKGLRVLLPKEAPQSVASVNTRETLTTVSDTQVPQLHTEVISLSHEVRKLSEKVLTQGETMVSLARELEQKKYELVISNREMEARNTAIAKYKDHEAENKRLEEENQRLRRELEESRRTPGWMFWKR